MSNELGIMSKEIKSKWGNCSLGGQQAGVYNTLGEDFDDWKGTERCV